MIIRYTMMQRAMIDAVYMISEAIKVCDDNINDESMKIYKDDYITAKEELLKFKKYVEDYKVESK